MNWKIWRRLSVAAAIAVAGVFAAPASNNALAAGGAYAVDDAGVDEPGDCKIEVFSSFARNSDRAFVVAPACVVSLGRPVEVGAEIERARSGGEWGTGLTLKAKTAIVPFTDEATFGMAVVGGVGFDLTSRETAEWFVTLPVSIRLSKIFQVNLNIGGLWDRVEDRNFVTWGAGFMLTLSEPLMLIGEIFGEGSERPGAQLGLRYTPHEKFDFDLIYGRNLTGEKTDWLTFGVNVRF